MRHFIVNDLMPADAIGFHGFLRMSPEIFNELLEMISPRLQNVDIGRKCVCVYISTCLVKYYLLKVFR